MTKGSHLFTPYKFQVKFLASRFQVKFLVSRFQTYLTPETKISPAVIDGSFAAQEEDAANAAIETAPAIVV